NASALKEILSMPSSTKIRALPAVILLPILFR
ncbi:MAG: hypothetical protein ACI8X3_003407, partial [Saprospiraceae bacterium]